MNRGITPVVTRETLAAFILRALAKQDGPGEWEHFMVAHYADQKMERARRECVRLIAYQADGNPKRLTSEEIEHLKSAATALT